MEKKFVEGKKGDDITFITPFDGRLFVLYLYKDEQDGQVKKNLVQGTDK
jgi:hypothetical protein